MSCPAVHQIVLTLLRLACCQLLPCLMSQVEVRALWGHQSLRMGHQLRVLKLLVGGKVQLQMPPAEEWVEMMQLQGRQRGGDCPLACPGCPWFAHCLTCCVSG
jgi:hypothetical protein